VVSGDRRRSCVRGARVVRGGRFRRKAGHWSSGGSGDRDCSGTGDRSVAAVDAFGGHGG
jgi:hypothetical protein